VLADQQLAEELRARLRHETDGLVATDSLLADLGRRHVHGSGGPDSRRPPPPPSPWWP
jgi:hypothetical protein